MSRLAGNQRQARLSLAATRASSAVAVAAPAAGWVWIEPKIDYIPLNQMEKLAPLRLAGRPAKAASIPLEGDIKLIAPPNEGLCAIGTGA
jgi:hypothetical protein